VARDITERKRAEEALRESNQTLHALIEASPLAIIAVDMGGAVRMWNAAAEKIFGWRAEEVMGRALPIVPAEQGGEAHAHAAGAPFGAALSDLETRRLRKDGSLIDVSLSFSALRDAAGAVVGVMTIAADITERRQLEEQLRQAQKLEAIGRLAGGVAHDFNNLLTVIGGRSHIIGWRLPEGDPLRHDVEIIEKTAERAAGLTRQLLAFSRKQVLEPRVLDLNEILGNMDRMLQRLIGEDIELVALLGPDLGRIRVDPSQIEQVVLNLAVNARDAMPEGGRLTIETQNVDLGEGYARTHADVEPGPYIMLAVSDTGHGMDATIQAQLFVPFFTTKEPGKGTGLGLATVYGIVRQSGGHIWVYSEVGQGSTFKVYLPRVSDPVDAVIGAPVLAPPPRGVETVLLAEDDDAVRALARETLQTSGYTVIEAAHPEAALRIAQTYAGVIDLLLTDVVMPGMSGRILADRLLPLRPGIKVLFMSGYTANAIVHHGVLDAGTAFLQKPFTPGALARRVREVLYESR
jgi:PAS domain S-box-containing protein